MAYQGMGNMCSHAMLVWWPNVYRRRKAVKLALMQAPMKPAPATNEERLQQSYTRVGTATRVQHGCRSLAAEQKCVGVEPERKGETCSQSYCVVRRVKTEDA